MATGDSKPPRRWRLRFGLRTFLLLATVLSVIGGLVGQKLFVRHQRAQALEAVRVAKGKIVPLANGGNRLYLTGDQINDAVLADLAPRLPYLPDLRELDLVGTKISDSGLPALRNARYLKSLWVFKTELTQNAIDRLQLDLPEVRIVRKQPDPVAGGLAMRDIYRHAIVSLAIEPRSGLLAFGNGDGELRLWRKGEAEPSRPIAAHGKWLFSCAFSHDGRQLATGAGDYLIKLWDAATGEQTGELAGHLDDVHGVAFSPDDKTLVSAGDDRVVRVWDLASGRQRFELEGHEGSIPNLAISPDGRLIATASRDDTIRLWDLERGQLLRILAGHEDDVLGVAFSADSQRLASASYDGTIRLWDVADVADSARPNPETPTANQILSGHNGRVFAVAFDSTGTQLASGAVDGLRLWNVETLEPVMHEPDRSYIATVRFLKRDKLLAATTADGELLVRRLPDGRLIRAWRDPESLSSATEFDAETPEQADELARN